MCPMTRAHKIETWIAAIVTLLLAATALSVIRWGIQKPITLRGAVLVDDTDPKKQLPIAGVEISAGDLAISEAVSDSSGMFLLHLRKPIRHGHAIVIHFRDPRYHSMDMDDYVIDKLYIVRLTPIAVKRPPQDGPRVKVSGMRVRYTVKALTDLNVGTAGKIFEVQNKGNVPCKSQNPCSPDGRWKAATASASLDAGAGNQFRSPRASCIAGPCPFTRIEADFMSQGGRLLTVSARNWSDTATFLFEAEVFRPAISQREHWSYPAIFGDGLSFTLPANAESVSIEAELDGQPIIFPLGPSLFLSWANCATGANPDKGRVYRCTPKPGYRFQ
jgi:hypothetical protein